MMIDTTLIDRLTVLAAKEKKANEYKRRLRIKGKITAKNITKNGNITLTIEKDVNEYRFTVLKTHKERYALAERLKTGKSVSIEGIRHLRTALCTRLKAIDKGLMDGKQAELADFKDKL